MEQFQSNDFKSKQMRLKQIYLNAISYSHLRARSQSRRLIKGPQGLSTMSNAQEYLAELSEAYFGLNDFFPFNKMQLISFDPKGYDLLNKIWDRP